MCGGGIRKMAFKKNTRKELFISLGSNFLLKDRELAVELSYPFRRIQKSNEESNAIIRSLESLKNCLYKPKKEDLDQLIPIWSSCVEDVRTYFQTVEQKIYIMDLSG